MTRLSFLLSFSLAAPVWAHPVAAPHLHSAPNSAAPALGLAVRLVASLMALNRHRARRAALDVIRGRRA